ncbi:uncharacterized protein LOC114914992 [Cajanus cajan]|uniref:uncharacterized protein LOC114914992 n=1 Tax=Cajanus cajan TaxID=3821 RepID=UPI0010FB5207|nr:uncharacterized protein LOC114914992 [Cajanus cajan]
MAQRGLGLSYRQAIRNPAPNVQVEEHRSVDVDEEAGVREARSPPRDHASPEVQPRKRKDKGKRKSGEVSRTGGDGARPHKHRRTDGSHLDLAIPSSIVARDFLAPEIRPSMMLSSDLLSSQGHRMLDATTPSAQWAMACELQVRVTAILCKLALEPMEDAHNLNKSLEETKIA